MSTIFSATLSYWLICFYREQARWKSFRENNKKQWSVLPQKTQGKLRNLSNVSRKQCVRISLGHQDESSAVLHRQNYKLMDWWHADRMMPQHTQEKGETSPMKNCYYIFLKNFLCQMTLTKRNTVDGRESISKIANWASNSRFCHCLSQHWQIDKFSLIHTVAYITILLLLTACAYRS